MTLDYRGVSHLKLKDLMVLTDPWFRFERVERCRVKGKLVLSMVGV